MVVHVLGLIKKLYMYFALLGCLCMPIIIATQEADCRYVYVVLGYGRICVTVANIVVTESSFGGSVAVATLQRSGGHIGPLAVFWKTFAQSAQALPAIASGDRPIYTGLQVDPHGIHGGSTFVKLDLPSSIVVLALSASEEVPSQLHEQVKADLVPTGGFWHVSGRSGTSMTVPTSAQMEYYFAIIGVAGGGIYHLEVSDGDVSDYSLRQVSMHTIPGTVVASFTSPVTNTTFIVFATQLETKALMVYESSTINGTTIFTSTENISYTGEIVTLTTFLHDGIPHVVGANASGFTSFFKLDQNLVLRIIFSTQMSPGTTWQSAFIGDNGAVQ